MSLQEEGQIQIHTENIFPIIKKAVYSDHEIFLRELVSNGIDAINKRRMASMAGDCLEGEEGSINIKIDRYNKAISITDNGIGMTTDEVKRYINQVAFSSAEDFLERYKNNKETIIGHFGLGFYSSFMVAKNVEIITKSAQENSVAVKWSCDGSPSFKLESVEKEDPGTEVILYIMEEEEEYLEPTRIRSLITKYCDFMPSEVKLEGEVVNKQQPLWRKSPKELTDKDYIDLYHYLYPFQGDPLLWVHLNTDYPYNLQGILYFPRMNGRADWESGEIKLYANQVFVSDSIKEIVPRYLLPLRGVIDSTDIPLNVSRSALQTDRRVRSIGAFISKKIADKLKESKESDPIKYSEIWDSLAPFVKIGAMEDEKFADQVSDLILFKTTLETKPDDSEIQLNVITNNDNKFTTLKDYINRIETENKKRIVYCTDEVSQAGPLNLWTAHGVEVINADTFIDTQFIPWLESTNKDLEFIRVDSELDDSLKENDIEISGSDGESQSETLRKIIKEALNNENITIQVQSLKGNDSPPALILLPEQMRRINDMGAIMEQKLPGLPDHHVLLINKRHSLIESLIKLKAGSVVIGLNENSSSENLVNDLAQHIYDMARLSVGGLDPKEISGFQSRSASLIGELMQRAL